MDTKAIGQKLIEYCRNGNNLEAISSLYSKDIVSVEARGGDDAPAESRGIDKVIEKNKWWIENHELHSAETTGPFPNRDRFAVIYRYEMTPKSGAMAGKRMKLEEVALYTVKDGKIVREEFYYDMG